MIVVDTNVIAYFWINGANTKFTENLLKKDSNWIAPFLWRSEFRNVLAGYLRKNLLTLDKALRLMSAAEEQLNNNEYLVTSDLVMNLVSLSSCSAYDCEFVALAKDFNINLVTSDKKIIKEFPSIAIPLKCFI
ncbi:MAG: type II toxin-antitoxin system VapC family toxin [Melioribacteraceae bacterium]|nr:type II toxin-antitoxin system VapC family toxin [Melioribacteraceae bacterium]